MKCLNAEKLCNLPYESCVGPDDPVRLENKKIPDKKVMTWLKENFEINNW